MFLVEKGDALNIFIQQVQSQIVCSPGTAYDPSVSELGAVGSLSTVHHCLMKEKSESHYDFKVLPKKCVKINL